MAAPPSFAAMAEKKVEDTPLRIVQLDGHVVLKIVKHCKEGTPTLVTGQLLGLDIGQTLEVTDCFPFPVRGLPTAAACYEHSSFSEGMYPSHDCHCLRRAKMMRKRVAMATAPATSWT